MISSENFSEWRADKFRGMAERIAAVGLKKDSVIPACGMIELLGQSQHEVMDFPYSYTHENPFPANDNNNLVNPGFDLVFDKATAFLA
jgi:hypothetical protein